MDALIIDIPNPNSNSTCTSREKGIHTRIGSQKM